MPAKKTATSKATTGKRKPTTAKSSTATKPAASPKTRKASSKGQAKSKAGDKEVTIDRRREADRRDAAAEAATDPTAEPKLEKREKVQRRRQIDPTTCERDYSDAEVEFMNAMDEYKRTSGRMFPTCSEVLEVLRGLGYVQLTKAEIATVRPEPIQESESTGELVAAEVGQEELGDADIEVDIEVDIKAEASAS